MAYGFFSTHMLHSKDPKNYFGGYKIISDQMSRERIGVIWTELESILEKNVPGDIVEFGCYAGTTSLFIRRQLDRCQQSAKRMFHVYDSFVGLPDKTDLDSSAAGDQFIAGALRANKQELIHQFKAAALQPPTIHKGWFEDITPEAVPEQIAFAFLDGDYYKSIIDSLRLVWPNMAPGGLLAIDDYKNVQLPGVDHAIQDFFQHKRVTIREQHNIALIQT